MWRAKKKIFFGLIFMNICVMTVLILAYGLAINATKNTETANVYSRTTYVWLDNEIPLKDFKEKINPVLERVGDKIDWLYCEGRIDKKQYIGYMHCGLNDKYQPQNDKSFTYSQINGGENVANIHYNSVHAEVGETVNICGKDFVVYSSDKDIVNADADGAVSCDYIIPLNAAPDYEGLSISYFCIVFKEMPDTIFNDSITQTILNNFETHDFSPSEVNDAEMKQRRKLAVFACEAVIAIIVLSLGYVYAFLFQKRRKQIGVLITCGCTPIKAESLFVLEMLIFTVIGSALAIPVSISLMPAFNNVFGDFSKFYTPGVYLIILISYIFATFAFIYIFIDKMVLNITESLKKGAM